MTIVNDNSRVITKLETSLIDDARVFFYDCHMFIVQATGGGKLVFVNSNVCGQRKDLTSIVWQVKLFHFCKLNIELWPEDNSAHQHSA
jgi:hypothetical protein